MSFIISKDTLNIEAVERWLEDDACGGIVIFTGTVRNHSKGKSVTALEFEAYEPMALIELSRIEEEIKSKWPVSKVALHHRSGRVEVGGIAVIAGVSSAHRAEAFQACEFLMKRLKETVPIWKKEICEDGEVWVTPNP